MARKIDFIVHNGAEVHAIRSLVDPESFVQSNVIGTFHILEAARKIQPTKFIYTSSAEVLGPAAHNESFNEEAALCPSNPYSASKAGGEMLVHAYRRSFAVPGIITRTMNLFGERQQNSKSVPMFTKKILEGEPVPLHIGPDGRYGTRQWMYVGNYVDALLFILGFGHIGETYHVAGYEQSNIDIAKLISEVTGCPLIVQNVDVSLYHKAHDLRYSISGVKIHEGGWSPRENFASTFSKTIRWYMEHRDWLDAAI